MLLLLPSVHQVSVFRICPGLESSRAMTRLRVSRTILRDRTLDSPRCGSSSGEGTFPGKVKGNI